MFEATTTMAMAITPGMSLDILLHYPF